MEVETLWKILEKIEVNKILTLQVIAMKELLAFKSGYPVKGSRAIRFAGYQKAAADELLAGKFTSGVDSQCDAPSPQGCR